MRLATRDRNFWELRSGEQAHAENPDSFWIPELADRQNLTRGKAAKLMFDIEATDEADGSVHVSGERMWVIVGPEHVIDIDDPLPDYAEWQLGQPPARRWPRE